MSRSFFLLAIFSHTLSAANVVLNWNQAVERTIAKNPELSGGRSSFRSSEYLESGSYSGYFPKLSASASYTYSNSFSDPGLYDGSNTSRYTAGITLSQNLFAGFLDAAKVDQAKANRQSAHANLEILRARLSFELKSAFASLSYGQKAIRLTDEIVQRRQTNLRLIELRFESGRENKGSLLLSRSYMEQAKFDHLQASNGMEVSRAKLASLLGFDESSSLGVTGEVPVQGVPPLGDLRNLAKQTPEYRLVVAQEQSADAAVTISRSAYFPTLGLTAATTNSSNSFFPSSNTWSVGATLTIPLFDGLKDYYAVQSAIELRNTASSLRENAQRTLFTKLNQTHNSFTESIRKLEVDTSFAEAAATRSKIARAKYNNGLLSFEDWDIIENDLINREKSLLQSERDRVIAEAAWEQALGKGVIP